MSINKKIIDCLQLNDAEVEKVSKIIETRQFFHSKVANFLLHDKRMSFFISAATMLFFIFCVVVLDVEKNELPYEIINGDSLQNTKILFYDSIRSSHLISLIFIVPNLIFILLYYLCSFNKHLNIYYVSQSWVINYFHNLKKFLQKSKVETLSLEEKYRLANSFIIKKLLFALLGSLLIFIGLVTMDSSNYTIITQNGIESKNYFSYTKKNTSWDAVKEVITGCNYGSSSENYGFNFAKYRWHYKLVMKNHKVIDVYDYKSPPKVTFLNSLMLLDSAIKSYNIPFRAQMYFEENDDIHMDSNARCREYLRKEYNKSDYALISRLLMLQN